MFKNLNLIKDTKYYILPDGVFTNNKSIACDKIWLTASVYAS